MGDGDSARTAVLGSTARTTWRSHNMPSTVRGTVMRGTLHPCHSAAASDAAARR